MYTKYRVGENTRGLSGTLTATAIILGVAVIRASTARAIVDVACWSPAAKFTGAGAGRATFLRGRRILEAGRCAQDIFFPFLGYRHERRRAIISVAGVTRRAAALVVLANYRSIRGAACISAACLGPWATVNITCGENIGGLVIRRKRHEWLCYDFLHPAEAEDSKRERRSAEKVVFMSLVVRGGDRISDDSRLVTKTKQKPFFWIRNLDT